MVNTSRKQADIVAKDAGADSYYDKYVRYSGYWCYWGRTYLDTSKENTILGCIKEIGYFIEGMGNFTHCERWHDKKNPDHNRNGENKASMKHMGLCKL